MNRDLVLLEIFHIWCTCGFYGPTNSCEFNFGSLDFNMTVRSDEAVGSRIHDIYIDGGEGGYQGGLTLSPVTQYFYLDDRDIRVSTCLPTGLTETLEIRMIGLGSTSCVPGYLHIEVIPTIPALKTSKFADSGPGGLGGPLSAMSTSSPPSVMSQYYEITVDDCSAEVIVDLFQIDFFNEGECVAFNCSVTCTNDYKIFWMGQENDWLIQTNLNDIIFNFVYELNVTCRESGLSVDIMDFGAFDAFEVTFVKACVTTENNTAQPHPTLESKSAPKHNSDTPIIQETTSLVTTEASHQISSSMLHNQVMKTTFSLPQSAPTDNANVPILTKTTSLLPTESSQVTVSTFSVFSSSTPIPIETEYPSMKYMYSNSTVDVSPLIVEASSMILSTSVLPGSALIKTSDLPKDNDKESTIIVPVVSSIAGVALLSVIGVSVYSLVSKRCRIVPLLQKKTKIEDKEETKNYNPTEDPEHGSQKSRKENPHKTDSIKFKISSKTPCGKKDSTKRHHHRHHKRQPGEQQFPKQSII